MPRSHRKKHPTKWVKRSDLKRRCPSGKKGFKQRGDALAANHGRAEANVYRCPDCKQFHLADPVGRRKRQLRARGIA